MYGDVNEKVMCESSFISNIEKRAKGGRLHPYFEGFNTHIVMLFVPQVEADYWKALDMTNIKRSIQYVCLRNITGPASHTYA